MDKSNTTSEFRVNLPTDVKLDGDYECALTEITYPYSWLNVHDGQEKTMKSNEFMIFHYKKKVYEKFTIVPNSYTLDGLTAAIYKVFQSLPYKNNLDVDYDPLFNRISFNFKKNFKLHLSDLLSYILGFDTNEVSGMAPNPPDMSGGFSALYVYCDILNVSIVGDKQEKLLRIVPVKGKYHDIVNQEFVNPDYVTVLQKNFSSIAISIKTDHDLPVPFKFGKSIIKLHFKKKYLR